MKIQFYQFQEIFALSCVTRKYIARARMHLQLSSKAKALKIHDALHTGWCVK